MTNPKQIGERTNVRKEARTKPKTDNYIFAYYGCSQGEHMH